MGIPSLQPVEIPAQEAKSFPDARIEQILIDLKRGSEAVTVWLATWNEKTGEDMQTTARDNPRFSLDPDAKDPTYVAMREATAIYLEAVGRIQEMRVKAAIEARDRAAKEAADAAVAEAEPVEIDSKQVRESERREP